MRVININLNGIRAAARKGFFAWLKKQNADFVCVQETRMHLEKQTNSEFLLQNYNAYFHDATTKGYSGTGIYTRHTPQEIKLGLGFATADSEGRTVALQFPHFDIISLYIPSGTSGDTRQKIKYQFLDHFIKILEAIKHKKRTTIIAGDINIAHKIIDIKNWRSNQTHSGFLPEERAWLDLVFDKLGFVDAFRVLNKNPNQYTWWSNFSHARDRNVGWRIDYQIITPDLKNKVQAVSIYNDERFSDHAPLIIDYKIEI